MDPQETGLFNIFLIAALLIGAVVFYFFYVMARNGTKSLKAMQQQFDNLLKDAENSRGTIVRELHNDIQPHLSALGLKYK